MPKYYCDTCKKKFYCGDLGDNSTPFGNFCPECGQWRCGGIIGPNLEFNYKSSLEEVPISWKYRKIVKGLARDEITKE